VGATILAAVTGRKRLSYSTLSKATTAARSMGRSGKERQDIDRAEENIEALTQQVETLGRELEEQLGKVEDRFDPLTEQLEVNSVRPRRSDVDVKLVALAWIPD
jgi:hypothetical protein